MGLDWRPLYKPEPGRERQFERLFNFLTGKQEEVIPIWKKIIGRKPKTKEQLVTEMRSIAISPYKTLDAPQVGISESATIWGVEQYNLQEEKKGTIEAFLQELEGYYVLELVPPCDGLPCYIAFHDEAHVFRAEFLKGCEDILGPELITSIHESLMARDTIVLGNEIMAVADKYAKKHNCQNLKTQKAIPEVDEGTPQSKAHILYAAAKWLLFWGEKGHGFEADF